MQLGYIVAFMKKDPISVHTVESYMNTENTRLSQQVSIASLCKIETNFFKVDYETRMSRLQ